MQNIEWQQLQIRLKQAKDEFSCDDDGHAFAYACAREIFALAGDDLEDAVTDGTQDLGIDAVLIDQTGLIPHVHLMQCKLHKKIDGAARKSFPGTEVNKLIAFFDALFGNPQSLKSQANPKLQERLEEIEEFLKSTVPIFTIYLVSNGLPLGSQEAAKLTAFCAKTRAASA